MDRDWIDTNHGIDSSIGKVSETCENHVHINIQGVSKLNKYMK